jgi:hypothetical protein
MSYPNFTQIERDKNVTQKSPEIDCGMTTPLFFVRILVDSRVLKEENQVPPRQGQKVGLYDNEAPHSHSCSDSDDLHLQPKGCEGRSSRFGK